MSPKPQFSREDFVDPDAPEGERHVRAGHPSVRDLSYDRSRSAQLLDLYKGAIFDPGWERGDYSGDTPIPTERLEIFVKEKARGKGYVADFLFRSRDLPVTVYGILINRGRGLELAELELFRSNWGYFDDWGDFVGAEAFEEKSTGNEPEQLITGDVLRRIPIGKIIAQAQQSLAQTDWRTEGIQVLGGLSRGPDDLTETETAALEAGVEAAQQTRRGRPPLPDETLIAVAHAYLEEAPNGVGLLRRMAERFDRPEPTIRDWIAAARQEGYLSPAVRGKRGAAPGPKLTSGPGRGSVG